MEAELLSWFGNLLNLSILVYLTVVAFNSIKFSYSESLLTAFGLMTSVLIQLRNIAWRKR